MAMVGEKQRRAALLLDDTRCLLRALGFKDSAVDDVQVTGGRNPSGVVTIGATTVFVKRFAGRSADARFRRSRSFAEAGVRPAAPFDTARVLGHDEERLTMAFECIPSAADFGEAIRERRVATADIQVAARSVAALHSADVADPSALDISLPDLPPADGAALPLEAAEEATLGELEMWRLLQRDVALLHQVQELTKTNPTPAPIHGDLRGDQMVIRGDEGWIIDWEELRWGDPARDIGSLCGELLYHNLLTLALERPGSNKPFDDAFIIEQGTEAVRLASKQLTAFGCAYESNGSTPHDPEFWTRSTRYIGWHLFDRAFASATYYGRLGAWDKAIAGIGRNLVMEPASHMTTIGLPGEAPCSSI